MPPGATSISLRVGSTPTRLNYATLAEQVYAYLREQILSNELPPNASLPEEGVAAQFAVSRVPVREALRRLAAEGLVTIVPRHGAVVSSLTASQFLDAYRVREALEVLAIRLAIPRLRESDLEDLERLQGAMAEAAAREDPAAFFAANSAFHRLIVDRAENSYLRAIYAPLMDQMRRYLGQSVGLRGGLERSLREHQAILQAARTGDIESAVRHMSEHIHVPQRVLEVEAAPGNDPAPPLPAARSNARGSATTSGSSRGNV